MISPLLITDSITPATWELRSRLICHREQIQAIAADYGISHIRIFGSVARGNATAESDIDFLVEMEPDRSLLDRIGCIQDLSDLLNCPIDVVTLKNIREEWRDRIQHEAISLCEVQHDQI